jgi:hypothetical protein
LEYALNDLDEEDEDEQKENIQILNKSQASSAIKKQIPPKPILLSDDSEGDYNLFL